MIIKAILVGNTIVTNVTPTDNHSLHSQCIYENISSVFTHQSVMSLNKSSGTHLAGSHIINLKSYMMPFRPSHSVACQSPVKLIREVQRNGLCSTLLAKFS